ncbi:unnamed protein product [Moneuplotes crassus]|uniref:Uncharacterized protein n=1 Tax=Euplotes crassus TaxID=5936 RepID=A0AAD1Y2G4_EUPCR|nr:unnamed protein product [Moneuplotes crassus]
MEIRRVEEHIIINKKKPKYKIRAKRENSGVKNRVKSSVVSPKESKDDLTPNRMLSDEFVYNRPSFSGPTAHKCEITKGEFVKLKDQLDIVSEKLNEIDVKTINSKASQNDMESIAIRLKRYFQKEMENLRDQNVIFHNQINKKVESQMIEKTDFYNEIADFIRFDDINVIQDRIHMIEQQIQNKSVSISESGSSEEESSEEEDEELDEVDDFLPNEGPLDNQEAEEGEDLSPTHKISKEDEIEQKNDSDAPYNKSIVAKMVNMDNEQNSNSSLVKPTIVKTLKIDKLILNNTEGSLSRNNSARDINPTRENSSVKNKKNYENFSSSTKLHKLDCAMYDHTGSKEGCSNNSPTSNKFNKTGNDFNIKIDTAIAKPKKEKNFSVKKFSATKMGTYMSRDISNSSIMTRSKKSTRSKLKNRMGTGLSAPDRFYNQRVYQISEQLEAKIKGVIERHEELQTKVVLNEETLNNHTNKFSTIDGIMEVLQKKIGYFETKGFLHFKKYYMGPLHDLESLRKKYMKRMDEIEADFKSFGRAIQSFKSKISKISTAATIPIPPTTSEPIGSNVQKERTLTDTQIHQGFIKCENEIDKVVGSFEKKTRQLREEIEKLKDPLENVFQDLVKEKECMGRQMDRYHKKYREIEDAKDDFMHKTTGFLNYEIGKEDFRNRSDNFRSIQGRAIKELRVPRFKRNVNRPGSLGMVTENHSLKRYDIQTMKKFVNKY